MKNRPGLAHRHVSLFIGSLVSLLAGVNSPAQSPAALPSIPPPGRVATTESVADQSSVNYVVRVQWTDTSGVTNHLQVLTTDGQFSLDSLQKPVKINDNEVPTTVRLQGTLRALNSERGRVTLFLGRTVPYVTGTSNGPGGKTSSYQQLSVGLNSTFGVTFGKPQVIQSDENGEVSILVSRQD